MKFQPNIYSRIEMGRAYIFMSFQQKDFKCCFIKNHKISDVYTTTLESVLSIIDP